MQLLEIKHFMKIMLGVKWPDQYSGRVMRVLGNNNDDVNQNLILIEFHAKKPFIAKSDYQNTRANTHTH